MKKYVCISFCLVFALLCGCEKTNTGTRFLFDTVVTLTADCDDQTLSGAFLLCGDYEKLLSATLEDSEISAINRTGEAEVSGETARIIEKALTYCEESGGIFDISIYPLSRLWNVKEEVVPSRDEIAAALENVDYQSITVEGNRVSTGGKKIDLGGIAKGYIADKTLEYFKKNNVKSGIINIGGNVYVFGDRDYNVGIKTPFGDSETSAVLKVKNKTVVTSGVYERSFRKDGVLYHHIIDTKTGYPADTDLLSATVICDSSADADAYSTVCILLGRSEAVKFIEARKNVEAVFIDENLNISYTSGIKPDGRFLVLNN